MKKLFLFLLALMSTIPIVQAQQFYEPSELDAMWRVWDSEIAFDWLIQNGQHITVNANPAPRYSHTSMTVPTEVCLTFVKDNKILCLTFSQSEGIRIFTENNVYHLHEQYLAINALIQQSWFNIDFEHITYSEALGWVLIPCGYYAGYNAIAINFDGATSIEIIQSDITINESVEYYNLQGLKVDPEKTKGEILIKTDGRKSEKVFNK
ncbi:MAG: hypothetical protein K2F87_04835 [Muribaculaceae bacterium]|nr:hypothetical protein [Muribaculaceae bacterium]